MAAGTPEPVAGVTSPSPDIGALYLRHREAMYRAAAGVLREAGRASDAGDAVQDAIVSILTSPPANVQNWEALLVSTAKRRALDRLKSASVRHSGGELDESHDRAERGDDLADDVATALDSHRRAALAWDSLAALDERHRKAVWDTVALERPRSEVAAELGVTPPRVSQMVTAALKVLRDEMKRKEAT
jgi:RNA polymerase sigma-70 factor (ECF subfamily)